MEFQVSTTPEPQKPDPEAPPVPQLNEEQVFIMDEYNWKSQAAFPVSPVHMAVFKNESRAPFISEEARLTMRLLMDVDLLLANFCALAVTDGLGSIIDYEAEKLTSLDLPSETAFEMVHAAWSIMLQESFLVSRHTREMVRAAMDAGISSMEDRILVFFAPLHVWMVHRIADIYLNCIHPEASQWSQLKIYASPEDIHQAATRTLETFQYIVSNMDSFMSPYLNVTLIPSSIETNLTA